MLLFIIIIALLKYTLAFEPSCGSCKHFIPNVKSQYDLGLCKMFKETTNYYKGKQIVLPNYAIHCRKNENLCGKDGFLYELTDNADKNQHENHNININDDIKDEEQQQFENYILTKIDELNNKCCGEINEKDEIEQLEEDFSDILQKIKKHNTKHTYKTSKDLYKLFKRDNKF